MRNSHCSAYCSSINSPFPLFLPHFCGYLSFKQLLIDWLTHSFISYLFSMDYGKDQKCKDIGQWCCPVWSGSSQVGRTSSLARATAAVVPQIRQNSPHHTFTVTPSDISSDLCPRDWTSHTCSFGTSSSHSLQMIYPASFSVVFEGF